MGHIGSFKGENWADHMNWNFKHTNNIEHCKTWYRSTRGVYEQWGEEENKKAKERPGTKSWVTPQTRVWEQQTDLDIEAEKLK